MTALSQHFCLTLMKTNENSHTTRRATYDTMTSGLCGLLQYSMRFLRASPFVSCPNTGVEISCARETPPPRVAPFRNWSADWKIDQRMLCKSFSFQSLKLGKNKIHRHHGNLIPPTFVAVSTSRRAPPEKLEDKFDCLWYKPIFSLYLDIEVYIYSMVF